MSLPQRVFSGLKVSVASAISHPRIGRLLNIVFQEQFPSRGIIAFTRSPAVSDTTRAQLFWGLFESGERRMVTRYLRGELDAVELGAGIGVISSYIAKRLQPGRRLLCVEANPGLVPLIEQNIAINAPGTLLTVVHSAVAYNTSGTIRIDLGADSHISSRIGSAVSGGGVEVPAGTLAALVEAAGVRGRFVLVADIEGVEHDIVAHDAATLERCDQIIAELHQRDSDDVDGLIRRIEALGFRTVARHGGVCVFDRV